MSHLSSRNRGGGAVITMACFVVCLVSKAAQVTLGEQQVATDQKQIDVLV